LIFFQGDSIPLRGITPKIEEQGSIPCRGYRQGSREQDFIPCYGIPPKIEEQGSMIYWLSKTFCYILLRVCFRLRVRGRENFPAKGGFILAGNHVSYLDPGAFGGPCPRDLYYMARDTLFRGRFYGWFLKKIHAFPLRRRAADFEAIRKGIKILMTGGGLLIFPEGTRRVGEHSGRAFAGVGFLARKAGVPVIPAYVSGTQDAMPKGVKWPRLRPVQVTYGKPIPPPSGDGTSDLDHSRKVMDAILVLKHTQ